MTSLSERHVDAFSETPSSIGSCGAVPDWAVFLPKTIAMAEVKEATLKNGAKRLVIEIPADAEAAEPSDTGCPLNLIARALALAEQEGCFIAADDPYGTARLVEPLSDRESEVLELVASGLSNQEIGDSLFITPGTVKSHLHSAFQKLSAGSRTKAVSRARELNLL